MTCVVGLIDKGAVYMGTDSIAIDGNNGMVTRENPKLFRLGSCLIGMSGSLRAVDVVRYKYSPPGRLPSQSPHEYMATAFVDSLKETLRQNSVTRINDNIEEVAANLIVGYDGHVFTLDEDFQVGVNTHPFAAIGSGWPIAMGALYATQRMKPAERVRLALTAAEAFCGSVRGPFHFIRLPAE